MFDLSDSTCAACSSDTTNPRSTDIRRVCKSFFFPVLFGVFIWKLHKHGISCANWWSFEDLMLATFSFKVKLEACLSLWCVNIRTLCWSKSLPLSWDNSCCILCFTRCQIFSAGGRSGLQVMCLTLLPLAGVPDQEVAWTAAYFVPKAVFTFQH